jgi:hypothetical protein
MEQDPDLTCDSCGSFATEVEWGYICNRTGGRLREVGPYGLYHEGPITFWQFLHSAVLRNYFD